MSNTIEKIRAEIERLKRNNGKDGRPSFAAEKVYVQLLSFLDTVEAERKGAKKIRGWVARDKANDLYFFTNKPHRTDGVFYSKVSDDILHLDNDMFPELSWKNEPIEVELEVNRKK